MSEEAGRTRFYYGYSAMKVEYDLRRVPKRKIHREISR